MARNTVRKVLAALCFHVSSKKLKTFLVKITRGNVRF